MNTIRKSQLTEEYLRNLVGDQFFSVRFVKKNGEVRDMTCRLGVTKHLRGGEDSTAHLGNIVNVFESAADTKYRKVNLTSVQRIKANKQTYIVGE